MTEITIEKVNNFWIDNGIVGLYKILRPIIPESSYIELMSDKLSIKLSDDNLSIVEIMNLAKTKAVSEYLKKTEGAGWIYRNDSYEVYQKTDFKMHLKPFFTGKTPSTEGTLLIPTAKDSELGGKGRRMTNEEYDNFVQFKEKNAELNINGKKCSLKGKGFIGSAPKYEIGEEFVMDFFEKGSKLCLFSGKKYKKADVITGMNYPFLTGKSGELNFVSQLNAKPLISSLYSFIGLFAFYNLHYLLQDDLKHYFILYDANLKELSNFCNTIEGSVEQITKPDYCNFKTEIIGTTYEMESFFNFLFSIYQQIKLKLNKDERIGILFSKSVYSMSNDSNIFRNVKEYTSISELFELFDDFENYKGENHLKDFANVIRYFSKRLDSGKYDTTWRNRLCDDILSFRSIHKTIEWFMGEVKLKEEKGGIAYLDKIIEIYNNKINKNMKVEMVDICKTVGNRIGAYCREKDDKGILFSIRNAKSRTEFINVLAETQFRTGVSYSDTFFKELPDNAQWEEYKALVSIFAMNSFLYKDKEQTK